MPAPAVIPAPRVYTKAVAVKTLVVEFLHPVTSDERLGSKVNSPQGGFILLYLLIAPEKMKPMLMPSVHLDPLLGPSH